MDKIVCADSMSLGKTRERGFSACSPSKPTFYSEQSCNPAVCSTVCTLSLSSLRKMVSLHVPLGARPSTVPPGAVAEGTDVPLIWSCPCPFGLPHRHTQKLMAGEDDSPKMKGVQHRRALMNLAVTLSLTAFIDTPQALTLLAELTQWNAHSIRRAPHGHCLCCPA